MDRTKLAIAVAVAVALTFAVTALWPEPRGARIFQRERCHECHSINGKGGGAAPDLSAVGSRRSKEYIIVQITDPKSHNPDTYMPSFARLPEKDIHDLADYLAGLR